MRLSSLSLVMSITSDALRVKRKDPRDRKRRRLQLLTVGGAGVGVG